MLQVNTAMLTKLGNKGLIQANCQLITPVELVDCHRGMRLEQGHSLTPLATAWNN